MQKILKQLKELDQETWTEITKWSMNFDENTSEYNFSCDIIQGCLQRAIVARKWDLVLEKFHNTYYAKITIPYECAPDTVLKDLSLESFMPILLNLYIRALEYQKV